MCTHYNHRNTVQNDRNYFTYNSSNKHGNDINTAVQGNKPQAIKLVVATLHSESTINIIIYHRRLCKQLH